MTVLEFQPWPKIARLNRNIVVTEKIDGTNAAVIIVPSGQDVDPFADDVIIDPATGIGYHVGAQSRNRLLTPESDNFGFAAWVHRNRVALVMALGEGRHFGEWWGTGIQRRYGLTGADKRFSLFNTHRHIDADFSPLAGQLGVVPVLYQGPNDNAAIDAQLERLRTFGSVAAPEFMDPEGIVVFHSASRTMFKVTLSGDEAPKSQATA